MVRSHGADISADMVALRLGISTRHASRLLGEDRHPTALVGKGRLGWRHWWTRFGQSSWTTTVLAFHGRARCFWLTLDRLVDSARLKRALG